MARKVKRRTRTSSATPAAAPPPRGTSNRERAIDAFMTLLADHRFQEIGLAEVAAGAGLRLSDLRAEFGSTMAILAAHVKDIDRSVLGGGEDMTEEPPRERLFDVLMRRLDALAPYKEAVRSLLISTRGHPGLALALNAMTLRSQTWMLEAAGIGVYGGRGAMRVQGAALLWARVLSVWVDDETEGLDRTMSALDRGLASAERWDGFVGDLVSIPACLLRGPRRRRRYREEDEIEAA